MMSNTQLLAIAKKQIGNTGGKYRSYAGGSGSWCNMYVYWLFNANGCGSLFPMKTKLQKTYCPTSIKWCRENLAEIPLYLAMPCDIFYMDWDKNGVPNHIGIAEKHDSTSAIYTIEGNTSGGKVDDKHREGRYNCGLFRPHFSAKFNDKILIVDGVCQFQTIGGLQKALKILGYYSGSIDTILGKSTVKAIQKLCGAVQDGAWGSATSGKFQEYLAKKGYYTGKIDKQFGKQSVIAMQRWVNANAYQKSTAKKEVPKKTETKSSTPTRKKMSKIGHARKDYDGKAGDSTGKEVCKTKFTYNPSSGSVYDWTYVFRPKDISKAEKAASMCEKACANNAIGYCSSGETKYGKKRAMTKLAKAAKYDLSKITEKCGCSCGDLICLCNHYAGLSTCYVGSGKQLAEKYKKNSNFQTIKYKKGMQLYRGDVLITAHANGKNNHVVMCL